LALSELSLRHLVDYPAGNSFHQAGFEGFVSADVLRDSRCVQVPQSRGVYLVVRASDTLPEFLRKSAAGWFKGRDPTVSVATLMAHWVPSATVLYIGQAGGKQSSATLRQRVWSYIRFGTGKPAGHRGGRYIWQLSDAWGLRFAWRPTPTQDPCDVEHQLLSEFKAEHGSRPFANLTG
jgi:hypothetical protein